MCVYVTTWHLLIEGDLLLGRFTLRLVVFPFVRKYWERENIIVAYLQVWLRIGVDPVEPANGRDYERSIDHIVVFQPWIIPAT